MLLMREFYLANSGTVVIYKEGKRYKPINMPIKTKQRLLRLRVLTVLSSGESS